MVEVLTAERVADMPSPAAVRDLYAAAAAGPPLHESVGTASVFAEVYRQSLEEPTILTAVEEDDAGLVAFATGHEWRWDEQQYPWAAEMREGLGRDAARLDASYALGLWARRPAAGGHGVGTRVLDAWLQAVGARAVWLATTDIDSPARRIYERRGFTRLGAAPDTRDGHPAALLLRAPTG